MSTISITSVGGKVILNAPYHPRLPAGAKALGGKFDGTSKTWHFDERDEVRVRNLAKEIYGTDGTVSDVVTLRLTAEEGCDEGKTMFWLGREVLTRRYRDEPVRLGDGVVRLEGHFDGRGGSMRYPRIGDCTGVVLEIRDIPAAAADVERDGWKVEVIDASVDTEALTAERARLAERIEEINALLAGAGR